MEASGSRKRLPIAGAYVAATYKASLYNHFVTEADGSRLAFNAVTNATARMNDASWARYQALLGGQRVDASNSVDRALLEGKFLVPSDYDELSALRSRHLQARYDSTSWALTVCPTIQCNFACDYCFEVHKPGKMSEEVQDVLVDMLEQRADRLRDYGVTWYGGEPTLAWDVVETLSARFIETCARHKISYSASMITNGFLLDKRKVDRLYALGIEHVQITLDGDAFEHDRRRKLHSGKGTFERILANIQLFIGRAANLSIRVNVDGRNRDGVHALIDRLAAAGLGDQPNISMYFAPVGSTTEPSHGVAQFCMTRKGFAAEEPEYYEHAARLKLAAVPYPGIGGGSCIAARPEAYVVQADGELHKCWDTVGQSQFAVGHLLDPANNPLDNSEYQRWMSWEPFDPSLGCRTCAWLPSCMGGCPLKAVHPELSPDGKVHLECTTYKFNVDRMLPLFVEALRESSGELTSRSCDG